MITENRLHHIIGVARKAYKIAKDMDYDEDFCRKCFALGWNHDIGYEFDPEHHARVGAEILKDFDNTEAIRYHGFVPENITTEWLILNLADMTTSPLGDEVTIDERLAEIKTRYGEEHEWYILAKDTCAILKEHFNDIA